MKNRSRVEPTRFMKRKKSKYAIHCHPYRGPILGNEDIERSDIYISDHCNKELSWIYNDGTHGYECHSTYKSSLFVSSNNLGKKNEFTVSDYEVYSIDYENRENIYKMCKYPNIIWKYIDTKDLSEKTLKQFDDERELLNDMDAIHCDDINIRLKISQCCLKNPSELLPDTQLVNKQYDAKLREWVGDCKWKLLYRASEHGYTSESFHDYCDDKGPTLIIIKSSGGWIFGGYTTESWSGDGVLEGIYYDII